MNMLLIPRTILSYPVKIKAIGHDIIQFKKHIN